MTLRALLACDEVGVTPESLVQRHQSGDWGDLRERAGKANDRAVVTGGPIYSSYGLSRTRTVCVHTAADRSVTTVLTPLEY